MTRLAVVVAALALATACGAEPAPVEAPPVAAPAAEAAPAAAVPVEAAPVATAGTRGDVAVCCEVNDMEIRPGGITKVPNWMLDAKACADTAGAVVDKTACAAAPRPSWMDEPAK